MKYDIILAGVGGQGVLSAAVIIVRGAITAGLQVRQSEVHGMAQRGGAVLSHLRLSGAPIPGDLVPLAEADLILSMEPLEALRYTPYLNEKSRVVCSLHPFINIPDYPPLEEILLRLKKLPGFLGVDDAGLAKQAGSLRAANMVLAGAAAPFLPIPKEALLEAADWLSRDKGPETEGINRRAFLLGFEAAQGGTKETT
ncbi:MAG: indolepyruvate oxidoreductase subunit beta [Spirochaetales bacterium]|nr:indolepyruvate oxidoreductase subunit beta [Spirochaetales bacterium]